MERVFESTKWALVTGIFFLLAQPISADTPKVLRVTAIPDEVPTELLRKNKPLVRYLEKQLGMKVKFIPVVDYAATVEALAAKKVDLASDHADGNQTGDCRCRGVISFAHN